MGGALVTIDSINAGVPKLIGVFAAIRPYGLNTFTGNYLNIAVARDTIKKETGI